MTSFVHTTYPTEHPGVARTESVLKATGQAVRGFDGAKGLAALLLGAVVSALLVVANQVVENWTDGNLLAAWIAMWALAFAAIALLAGPARKAAHRLRTGFAQWSERRQREAADERMWDLALRDARVMAEISRAMSADPSVIQPRRYAGLLMNL